MYSTLSRQDNHKGVQDRAFDRDRRQDHIFIIF